MPGRSPRRFPADQAHEDLLERALASAEVAIVDAELLEAAEQRRDAGLFARGIEIELQLMAVLVERKLPLAELLRNFRERLLERQGELSLAQLLHQRRLLLHDDQLAMVDDSDAVGHLLGLVD